MRYLRDYGKKGMKDVSRWKIHGIRNSQLMDLEDYPHNYEGERFINSSLPSGKEDFYLSSDSPQYYAFFLVWKHRWSSRHTLIGELPVKLTPLRRETEQMWREIQEVSRKTIRTKSKDEFHDKQRQAKFEDSKTIIERIEREKDKIRNDPNLDDDIKKMKEENWNLLRDMM
jgi:hypothetical protein